MKTVLNLFFYLILSQAEAIETCYTEGECLNSPYISLLHTETAKDCHEECLAREECAVFTWYESNNVCMEFTECIEFSNLSCSDCLSGLKDCQEPVCFEKGRCLGNFLQLLNSETENDCLQFCKSTPACNWFTFDEQFHECSLLDGCSNIDASCASCQSGQKSCQEKQEYTKMMILVGVGHNKIEIIDLSSTDTVCKDPPQLEDLSTFGSPSFMYRDTIHICGGRGSQGDRSCYFYDHEGSKWSETTPMIEDRFHFNIARIGYEEYWFLGGCTGHSIAKESTEILRNGTFQLGPEMPMKLGYYCLVQINSSFVFIGGGFSFDFISNTTFSTDAAYLIDLKAMKWIELPNLITARHAHSCGFFKDEESNIFIVAAGGRDSVFLYRNDSEILDLRTMTWTPGPDLPYPIAYSDLGVTQFKDHFIITGGEHKEDGTILYHGNLLMFDKSRKWQIVVQSILPRSHHSAILIPNKLTDCQ